MANAQGGMPIILSVVDTADSPVAGALVRVESGSTTYKGNTSGNGEAMLHLPDGHYRVAVSLIGMEELADSIVVDSLSRYFSFILRDGMRHLAEVSVTALQPFVSNKPGKLVVNLKNSPLSAETSAWQILRFSPNVHVDQNDRLTVLNQTTAVYVNQRLLTLGADELKDYLENMPGESVERIEVVHAPGASALANTPTEIRIYTSSNEYEGYRGSARASMRQNTFFQHNYGFSADWRKDKISLQTSLNSNQNKHRTQGDMHTGLQGYPLTQTQADQAIQTLNWNTTLSFLPSMRTQYYATFQLMDNDRSNNNLATAGANAPAVERGMIEGKSRNASFTLGALHEIDSARQVSFQAEYLNNSSSLQNAYVPLGAQMNAEDLAAERLERSSPAFFAHGKYRSEGRFLAWEAGLRHSGLWMSSTNRAQAQGLDYKLDEQISALFSQVELAAGQWNFQAGLRAEHSRVAANFDALNGNHFLLERSYTSLFPSLLAQYGFTSGHSMELSFKRSINRPDYYQLNPLRRYTGALNRFEGDEHTRPAFANILDLTASFPFGLQFSAGAQFIQDLISTYFLEDQVGEAMVQRYQNFDDARIYYAYSSYTQRWGKRWASIANVNAFYAEAAMPGVQTAQPSMATNMQLVNQIVLGKGWVNTLSYNLSTAFSDGFFRHRGSSSLDYSLQKTFARQGITLQLALTDILRTDKEGLRTLYNNLNYMQSGYADNRRVRMTLIYRFGKQKLNVLDAESLDDAGVKERLQKQ